MLLQRKLLCSIAGSIVAGVATTVVLVIVLMIVAFPDWVSNTKTAMINAETNNLKRLSLEKSEYSNVYYKRVRDDIDGLCTFTSDIKRGAINTTSTITRYSTLRSDYYNVPGWSSARGSSLQVSGWYQCAQSGSYSTTCTGVTLEGNLPASSQRKLDESDPLEVVYRSLVAGEFPLGRGGFWSVAYEDTGLLRLSPYLYTDTFQDWEGICVRDNQYKRGYDGRCRPWYQLAIENEGTQYTAPYYFASVGQNKPELGVTSSMALYDLSSMSEYDNVSPGVPLSPAVGASPYGVCQMDFAMTDVSATVSGTRILEGGYGYLIKMSDASAVTHPKLDWATATTAPNILELEFGSSLANEAVQFRNTILFEMQAGRNGTDTYTKGGEVWHISYYSVPVSGYSLALTVAEKDIRQPFEDARSRINAVVAVQAAIVAAVLVVVAVLATAFARRVSNAVVKPVKLLLELIIRINTRKFSEDGIESIISVTEKKYLSRELATLDGIFRQMYLAMKVGQASFLQGDMDAAAATFSTAMTLFARLGHLRGIGVCYTNLGAIYMSRGAYTQAISTYEQAVNNAQEMLDMEIQSTSNNTAPQATGSSVPSLGQDTPSFFVESPIHNPNADSSHGTKLSHVTIDMTTCEPHIRSMMETVGLRKLNLAKAYAERARLSLETYKPAQFHPKGSLAVEQGQLRKTVDVPVPTSQAVQDIYDAARIAAESVRLFETCQSTLAQRITARCDALYMYALANEVSTLFGGNASSSASSPEAAMYFAEEQLQTLLHEYHQWSHETNSVVPNPIIESEIDIQQAENADVRVRVKCAHARLFAAKNDFKGALALYANALESDKYCSSHLIMRGIEDMCIVCRRSGQDHAADTIYAKIPSKSLTEKRDFVFLLDTSGSMAGSLLRAAVTNMVKLYDDHVDEQDRVAVYTFSTLVMKQISLTQKGDQQSAHRIRSRMKSLTNANGLTACYDAISHGLDEFNNHTTGLSSGHKQVIVCLTDGEDNMSKIKPNSLIQRLKNEKSAQTTMLIIIGVGMLRNADTLRALAEASNDGSYVSAANGLQDLDAAFKRVSELISGVSLRLETM